MPTKIAENEWVYGDGEQEWPLYCPHDREELQKLNPRPGSMRSYFCGTCKGIFATFKVQGPWDATKRCYTWNLHLRQTCYHGQTYDKPAPYCLVPWRPDKESTIVPDAEFHELFLRVKHAQLAERDQ